MKPSKLLSFILRIFNLEINNCTLIDLKLFWLVGFRVIEMRISIEPTDKTFG